MKSGQPGVYPVKYSYPPLVAVAVVEHLVEEGMKVNGDHRIFWNTS